jgi:hypothetical protein
MSKLGSMLCLCSRMSGLDLTYILHRELRTSVIEPAAALSKSHQFPRRLQRQREKQVLPPVRPPFFLVSDGLTSLGNEWIFTWQCRLGPSRCRVWCPVAAAASRNKVFSWSSPSRQCSTPMLAKSAWRWSLALPAPVQESARIVVPSSRRGGSAGDAFCQGCSEGYR